MSALATVTRKKFNGKFTEKFDFTIGHFMVTIANADIESIKSLHTLFDKYLDNMQVKFEQNRMVRIIYIYKKKKKKKKVFDEK